MVQLYSSSASPGQNKQRFPLVTLLVVLIVGLFANVSGATGTPAGTNITATATATYEDANSNQKTATGQVLVTVRQVAGVTIEAAPVTEQSARPNTNAAFPVTLKNTGNGSDTLTLAAILPNDATTAGWKTAIYPDSDSDGILDTNENTPISNTGSMAADTSYKIIVVVTPPAGATDGTRYDAVFTATSQFNSATSASRTFKTTITDVFLTLTVSASPANPKPGTQVTYTYTLRNTGTGTATGVSISNAIPSNTTYSSNSIVLNNTGRSDTNDGDGATYDNTSHTITIDPGNVTGNSTVTWSYLVTINEFVDPNTPITNQATVTYKDTNNQNQSTSNTDTSVQVAPKNAVTVAIQTPSPVSALPGDTVKVQLSVTNGGNVADVFSALLGWTNSNFEWKLYADTDGDGTKDSSTPISQKTAGQNQATATTGTMQKNITQTYVVELVVPGNTVDGATDTLTITTTSQGNSTVSNSKSLIVNVTAPKIDMSITAQTVDQVGPAPGEDITYTITATNNGHAAAKNVRMELPIPTNTSYKTGTIYVGANLVTDALDTDQGGFDSQNNKVVVTATDLPLNESLVVKITVKVQ